MDARIDKKSIIRFRDSTNWLAEKGIPADAKFIVSRTVSMTPVLPCRIEARMVEGTKTIAVNVGDEAWKKIIVLH